MSSVVTVATCSLNQWSLDFQGNLERILASIRIAKAQGAKLRIGPELEITGYGCQDHFLEADTETHAWEVLVEILKSGDCRDIIIDVGMPLMHNSILYNVRIVLYNSKILLIRPKMWMANDGNYRELRWFTPWISGMNGIYGGAFKNNGPRIEEFILPEIVRNATGQITVPIGDVVLQTLDTTIGVEMCEELFTPLAPHISLALAGVEIFTNSSGSHHQLRKLNTRIDLIKEATLKSGGLYLYANQQGCDGDRLYYDGCPLIALNGSIVSRGSQFSLNDVEVVIGRVDLETIRSHRRGFSSRCIQGAITGISGVNTGTNSFEGLSIQGSGPGRVRLNMQLGEDISSQPEAVDDLGLTINENEVSRPIEFKYLLPEEEIALGPACWLWDYLRRSKTQGFFLPLSGGIDSCATAVIVHSMCREVAKAATQTEPNMQVIQDARQIAGLPLDSDYIPSDPQEFASRIFHTGYMSTQNSSNSTRLRAQTLAQSIGAFHLSISIDTIVSAILSVFEIVTLRKPKFAVFGGSNAENLALQNIQARIRMVVAYLMAQLMPWVRGRNGGLLVLGSANVDESLRGYLTKYDCSSADINPIGGISKTDLKRFIAYAETAFDLPILGEFLSATPTAELEPITESHTQSDEADMGMSYEELSIYGRLRKLEKLGPYSMFMRLISPSEWGLRLSPTEIAEKVKLFWFEYARNRHKMTTITPAYHAENYSPDDNRFDLRPFLYPARFPWQFKAIDAKAATLPDKSSRTKAKVE